MPALMSPAPGTRNRKNETGWFQNNVASSTPSPDAIQHAGHLQPTGRSVPQPRHAYPAHCGSPGFQRGNRSSCATSCARLWHMTQDLVPSRRSAK